jgi:phytol kinase
MAIYYTIITVFIILLFNELWWRFKKPNDEISRKAVHIIVGCFVAFWPFYLSWLDIQLLGIAFFITVYISKHLNIFKAIHSVQRPTWGELFFAISVTSVAFITHDKLVYMTAILSMGLADGLAAIFGSYFGSGTNYRIFGSTKSVVGSLTFLVVIIGLLDNYRLHVIHPAPAVIYLLLAVIAMILENVSVLGLDNLAVPLLIAIWLR